MRRTAAAALTALCAAAMGLSLLLLPLLLGPAPHSPAVTPESAAPSGSAATAAPDQAEGSTGNPQPYRAVWLSYLEWQTVDFSSQDSFTQDISSMLDNCAALGATVVIAHVRPFGDALYPSRLFPFSHLCTGVQGKSPGFDPLAVLVREAHARGLEAEAWINPYRLQSSGMPEQLCETGLAGQHPEWVREASGGLWLSPALAEVREYIAAGVQELCEDYDIDGIHFDDYFYPTTDESIDAGEYAEYCRAGGAMTLDDWRRGNVTALVQRCWEIAHEYGVRFGISPQGNLENNYTSQYSDVGLWLSEPGYVDYLMPQIYWGMEYTQDGSDAMALPNCLAAWQALPRDPAVQLYVGLGAYRIGDGDGADGEAALREWQCGSALAEQASYLAAQGVDGAGLYRYDSLFRNTAWPELAELECQALRTLWAGG